MALVVKDGALLKEGDGLASGQECCCKASDIRNACCYWSCDYEADIVWPDIEDPDDFPDISEAMIAAGWVLVAGLGWVKTIVGEENCNDPEVFGPVVFGLQGEVDGIVGPLGGTSIVNIAGGPGRSGPGCIDIDQQSCEEVYLGTFYANTPCEENPCCSGACDEENPCKNTFSTGWNCDCVEEECVPAENPLP